MYRNIRVSLVCLCLAVLSMAVVLQGQRDPGARPVSSSTTMGFPTLNTDEQALFMDAMQRFQEIDSVTGSLPGEAGKGLGPTFNGNSCAQCHAFPSVGGSSPRTNPQVQLAKQDGAGNFVPSFIRMNGPVREARFIRNHDGSLDGGVHGIYTIQGRVDAPGCQLSQPDFATELARNNVIFRTPTPTFGLGLIENTSDLALEANLALHEGEKNALGIAGRLNTSGNDGTVTRFGWKAQNKSLLIFAGEAYNVEQGVSNELFPNERSAVSGCVFNATPEDATNILNPNTGSNTGTASAMSSDVVNFAAFMRLTAPLSPIPLSASAERGEDLFERVGCALCHSPTLTTANSPFTGMSNFTYHPYSDIAIHHMGSNLADGIHQGAAGPDEFRTAPLWGTGQKLFFLHDGRTADLLDAIRAHAGPGSEANGVIHQFERLSPEHQQHILDFLRSL